MAEREQKDGQRSGSSGRGGLEHRFGGFGLASLAVGLFVVAVYAIVEARGIVFGETDSKSDASSIFGGASGGRSRSSSGWGYSGGYHGGK